MVKQVQHKDRTLANTGFRWTQVSRRTQSDVMLSSGFLQAIFVQGITRQALAERMSVTHPMGIATWYWCWKSASSPAMGFSNPALYQFAGQMMLHKGIIQPEIKFFQTEFLLWNRLKSTIKVLQRKTHSTCAIVFCLLKPHNRCHKYGNSQWNYLPNLSLPHFRRYQGTSHQVWYQWGDTQEPVPFNITGSWYHRFIKCHWFLHVSLLMSNILQSNFFCVK